MLTSSVLTRLQSPEGQELLQIAHENLANPIRASRLLRRHAGPEMAAAALTQVVLRLRAREKFGRASEMFFDRQLLEQASGEEVSRWRAQRFTDHAVIADLCCGLGGDSIGLGNARTGQQVVVAIDRDPLALQLASINTRVCGLAHHVLFSQATVPDIGLRVSSAFIDPSRRKGPGSSREGSRTRRLTEMSPSISEVLSLTTSLPNLAIKLSPATSHAALDWSFRAIHHEREFASVRGECRECIIWTGSLARYRRSAARLPEGVHIHGDGSEKLDIGAPGCYLYEPDAAVIRAGLVARLAGELNAWGLSSELAYLTNDTHADHPLAKAFCLREVQPFSRKALVRMLRVHGVTEPTIKTRGFAVSADEIRRWTRPLGTGGRDAVLFLTRVGVRPMMMLGERVGSGTG